MVEPITRRVYVVDDEEPVRDALVFLLQSFGIEALGFDSAASLLKALEQWAAASAAPIRGCFLLDVRLGADNGLALHANLVRRGLTHPVIFLTGHGDVPMAVEALKRGAFDFIEKPYSDHALIERIEAALALEQDHYTRQARSAECGVRLARITPREREVMLRVAAGKLNKIIADELNVAVRTVEVHRARVFAKLGVRSAAELATWLAQNTPSNTASNTPHNIENI